MNEKEVLYRKPPKRQRGGRKALGDTSVDGNTKALIYARVSSLTQKADGHGLESQESRCRDFASRKGYEVEKVFTDAASGKGEYTTRPGQVEVLKYIDTFPYRKFVVLVDDISRLARDVRGHFGLREAIRRRGVSVESPNFNFEDTPEGEMVEGMTAVTSEYQRKVNRRQVIQKMRARLDSGYWPFGPRTGYKHIRHSQHGVLGVPTESAKEILKPALELFAAGVLQRKIDVARYLVEKGFWKKQRPEKYIDKITNIMLDPFYCGDIAYERWEVSRREGHHEGVISRETHDLIKKRLQRGEKARVRIDTSPDFPLRGLLVCGGCRKPMTAAWSTNRHSKKYGYYLCQNRECVVHRKSTVRREKVENDFIELLKRNHLKEGVQKLVIAAFESACKEEAVYSKGREQLIAEQAKKAKERVRQLTDLILAANKSEELKAAYEEQLEEAHKDLRSLEALKPMTDSQLTLPYQTALDKSILLLKEPDKAWQNMDVFEKHLLFFFVFEEKLPYSKNDGYQTADSACATRLFEEFAEQNTVGCGGGENRTPVQRKMCECFYEA